MSIRDITSGYNLELVNEEGQQLHKVWELDALDDILLLERYGSFCGWSEIKLKKKDVEVYRIKKPWGSQERSEFFFNQPARIYVEDQFSSVEYVMQVAECGRFPSAEEFAQEAWTPQ